MAFKYLEEEHGNRSGWKFWYNATELTGHARAKAVTLLEEERGIERALAACLAGGEYSGRDEDVTRFRKRHKEKGKERERCDLLARELARAGPRVFELELGYLVYLEMDEAITDAAVAPESGSDAGREPGSA